MKLQQHEHLEIINYLLQLMFVTRRDKYINSTCHTQVIKEQICTATDGVSDIIRNNWIIFLKAVPQTQW